MKTKNIVTIALISVLAHGYVHASKFGGVKDIIGCGTIVSVRSVNQAPTYTKEYEAVRPDRFGGSSQAAGILGGFGVIGSAVALVGSLAVDTAIEANVKTSLPVDAPDGGVWRGVRAVKIKFDDGREIHMPFIEMLDVPGSRRFKVGERYSFNYSKELDNIQFFIGGDNLIPNADDEKQANKYRGMCRTRVDQSVADSIIERSASLVDESKIIE